MILFAQQGLSNDEIAVREVVRAEAGRQVGTVGYSRAEPGAINVIPGRAEFPVELRDRDAAIIDRMWERIQERFKQTDKEENVETRCTALDDVDPARSDPATETAIRPASLASGGARATARQTVVRAAGLRPTTLP